MPVTQSRDREDDQHRERDAAHPAVVGTSARRERCHQEGPWYSSSIGGSPCARWSRIRRPEEARKLTYGPARPRQAASARVTAPFDKRGRAFRTFASTMTTSEAVDAVVKVLAPYIGDTMARSATEAHCQKLGIAGAARSSPEQLEACSASSAGVSTSSSGATSRRR